MNTFRLKNHSCKLGLSVCRRSKMEEKLMIYLEIHQLTKQRLRVSQIAKRLKISRTTVYKYLETTFEEAVNEFDIGERKKILDPYRDWIVNWLKDYLPSVELRFLIGYRKDFQILKSEKAQCDAM
ncbi:HTH domain-containing protein [Niallia taxi]|uniref:HTH domain-containing protein n=1 Tax=Niallia taxi TaxID=2499688 RepID=A0A3S2TRE7_9BACI|nr:HTH domain-containing protein [Niallia taxi]